MNRGIVYAVAAYVIWGLFPLYYRLLAHVSALQLTAHRVVWSALALAAVIVLTRQWPQWRASAANSGVRRIYAVAAVLIAINWFAFIWAVNAGQVLQTSLGYFITPLVNVLLGALVLRERLRAGQWCAIALTAVGVIYLVLSYGSTPWAALVLALSFGSYGLVKKTAPLPALDGLLLETAILVLPALVYLVHVDGAGTGAFLRSDAVTHLLLTGTGLVSTTPLLLFAAAARRIPLTLVGLLFYVAPTLQFLLGVLVYHEPFTHAQAIGFGIVWVGLLCFSAESALVRRGLAATS